MRMWLNSGLQARTSHSTVSSLDCVLRLAIENLSQEKLDSSAVHEFALLSRQVGHRQREKRQRRAQAIQSVQQATMAG